MHSSTIQQKLFGAKQIPADVIDHIYKERWLQIWVPKMYDGLGLNFTNGLKLLKSLAFIDGSLGRCQLFFAKPETRNCSRTF